MSGAIFLVRHGQTTLNAEGRFRGRRDVPLDDRGFVQAAEASRGLVGTGVTAVYTSPLRRTVQTAEFVADACGARIIALDDLIDLDHGWWEGLTPEEAAERDPEEFRRFQEDPRRAAAPGGETMAAVEGRVLGALWSIAARHERMSVAAVSHEIPIRLVRGARRDRQLILLGRRCSHGVRDADWSRGWLAHPRGRGRDGNGDVITWFAPTASRTSIRRPNDVLRAAPRPILTTAPTSRSSCAPSTITCPTAGSLRGGSSGISVPAPPSRDWPKPRWIRPTCTSRRRPRGRWR